MLQRLNTERHYIVTGGAGFVGSHVVLALVDRGDRVTVIDNLRQGHREAVPPGVRLVVADLADTAVVDSLLSERRWDGVLHFASLSLVGESVVKPLHYLLENGSVGLQLIDSCIRHHIPRMVLSSTANLFGEPEISPISESARIAPSSPYGESKFILERALYWADKIHGMRSACLRYFNAAGADPEGRAGEDHTPESHLIPIVIDAALGRRPELTVFGSDYPTPDGTCIRDYVHVSDLADAHLRALDMIDDRSVHYNLGNGRGHSVLDIVHAVERVTGLAVPMRLAARRPGDPASLVSASGLVQRETGWSPRFTRIDDIVQTAYAWRLAHPHGYASVPAKVA
jgi:UDP-glucose 4-epimerase